MVKTEGDAGGIGERGNDEGGDTSEAAGVRDAGRGRSGVVRGGGAAVGVETGGRTGRGGGGGSAGETVETTGTLS